jgi:hypothetical protein
VDSAQNVPTDIPTIEPAQPKLIMTVSTPHIDQGPDGEYLTEISSTPNSPTSSTDCGYQWAYQSLPELSSLLDQTVRSLIPNSASHATAFGENCLGNNGEVIRFIPMETDYYITITVDSLTDYQTFGNWISIVMQAVNGLPTDMIIGPKPGFVEFVLQKNESERKSFRVPIQDFASISNGLTGEDLFQRFMTVP